MKFTTTLAAGLAPVALAKKISNNYARAPDGHGAEGHAVEEVKEVEVSAPMGMIPGAYEAEEGHALSIYVVWYNMGAGVATQTVNPQHTVTKTVMVEQGGMETAVHGVDGTVTTVPAGGSATVPATGATHTVMVGGGDLGALTFTPPEAYAEVGDMIIFNYMAQNHSVTQVSFDDPCVALPGGMDSGFVPNPNNTVDPAPQVAMQVMTTDTISESLSNLNSQSQPTNNTHQT